MQQAHKSTIFHLISLAQPDKRKINQKGVCFMVWELFIFADLSPPSSQLVTEMHQPRILSIALYYSPRCPYSKKVLSYLRQQNLSIPLKDVTVDKQAKEELQKIGGYSVVPCLIINGEPIYDPSEIIDWLSEHKEELKK